MYIQKCLSAERNSSTREYLRIIGRGLEQQGNDRNFFFFRPAELQFYTSISSILVQIPATFLFVDSIGVRQAQDTSLLPAFIINGIFFHFQSISAYVLMDYISPVTHR